MYNLYDDCASGRGLLVVVLPQWHCDQIVSHVQGWGFSDGYKSAGKRLLELVCTGTHSFGTGLSVPGLV